MGDVLDTNIQMVILPNSLYLINRAKAFRETVYPEGTMTCIFNILFQSPLWNDG